MQEDNANEESKGPKEGSDFDADGKKDSIKRKINYREEKVEDCECIYG